MPDVDLITYSEISTDQADYIILRVRDDAGIRAAFIRCPALYDEPTTIKDES